MSPQTVDEKKWQAEDDARTLKEYHIILKDKDRLKRARKILKEQVAADKAAMKATG
jgi:hypothetical protein